MGEMMEQVHVDPGLAAREDAFATACHRCLTCADSELCGHWLQQGGGNAAPFFCPNASKSAPVRTPQAKPVGHKVTASPKESPRAGSVEHPARPART